VSPLSATLKEEEGLQKGIELIIELKATIASA
jgi:hypothetical protein